MQRLPPPPAPPPRKTEADAERELAWSFGLGLPPGATLAERPAWADTNLHDEAARRLDYDPYRKV